MNLIIENLPIEFTSDELQKMFEPFGHIEFLHISENTLKNSNGIKGFIQMPLNSQALDAYNALNGKIVNQNKIRILPVEEPDDDPKR